MRLLRFATVTALAAVVAFGTGCPEPIDNDAGADARADARTDATDTRVNETGTDTGTDVATDTGIDSSMDTGTDSGPVDSGVDVAMDTGVDVRTDVPIVDVTTDTGVDAGTDTSGISAVRAAAAGTLSSPIAVSNVTVTYLLPAVGADPAGFFVQAVTNGPALFVAVDPTTLTPSPAVGDVVSFSVTTVATPGMMTNATAITGFAVASSGSSVEPLRQDLSGASDLISALNSYDSELIHLEGTIAMAFGTAGAMHSSAQITTAGITSPDTNLRLRVTDTVRNALDLAPGCTFAVDAPLWRFNSQAQVSAWSVSDITVNSCPAPRVTAAVATSSTSVDVTFDRAIEPASLVAAGTQFTITAVGGVPLPVSAASVSGRVVTLTTASQMIDTPYTVTVDGTLTDTLGTAIDPAARTAMFMGFRTRAIVRINELNANITGSCDLIELRVVQGGALGGFVLRERDTGSLVTFPTMTVATNDLIVVHINGSNATCNPSSAMNETTSITQYPAATNAPNYDTAYDFWSTDTGITSTDNVITLYDASMNIVDVLFVTDAPTGTAAAGTETAAAAAAAAGEWTQVGGGVPAGGFVDDTFSANAVIDLDATGTSAAGTSIQRINNADTNTMSDWNDTSTSTWGALNPGQTAF